MSAPVAPFTIWVDVEDLFQYCEANRRPSGIQRLVFEILRVIESRAAARPVAPRIAFVRRSPTAAATALHEVPFAAVEALFAGLAHEPQQDQSRQDEPRRDEPARLPRPAPRPRASAIARVRRGAIRGLQAMPRAISEPALDAAVEQLQVLRLARGALRGRAGRPGTSPVPPVAETPVPVPVSVSVPVPAHPAEGASGMPAIGTSGDIFLLLGAPWSDEEFAARLDRLRDVHGLRPVLLLYDLIPLRRPEWCAQSLVRSFGEWLDATLPHCDRLLAISQATARDVEAYARERGLSLRAPVQSIPLGTGFSVAPPAAGDRACADSRPPGLPAPGSYVLFVSTLEARKNHALLCQIWRRLLAELPREAVPTLVFAGRVGWLVADLLQQLDNAEWLHGKIRLLRDPTDAEVAALYRGCLFTVFPSLFEGWGLPVTESLALGRPCVAADNSSIPEAGGQLARYLDAEDVEGAFVTLRDIILDREGLARWQAEVRRDFRPVPWENSADAVLEACEAAAGRGRTMTDARS